MNTPLLRLTAGLWLLASALCLSACTIIRYQEGESTLTYASLGTSRNTGPIALEAGAPGTPGYRKATVSASQSDQTSVLNKAIDAAANAARPTLLPAP